MSNNSQELLDRVFNHDLPVCFVGGPYTKPDPSINVNRMAKLVDELWRDGVVFPICPMIESHIQHLLIPREYEDWLLRTMRFIPLCDVGFFRYGESSGMDREKKLFDAKGIPYFSGPILEESKRDMYVWVKMWQKTRSKL